MSALAEPDACACRLLHAGMIWKYEHTCKYPNARMTGNTCTFLSDTFYLCPGDLPIWSHGKTFKQRLAFCAVRPIA